MLRQRLDITLYRIETAAYSNLHLLGLSYPHWIVSHVKEGHVMTEAAGHRFEVPAGSAMLHPPRIAFSEFAEGPGVHQWLLFDATVSDSDADTPLIDLFLRWPVSPVIALGDRKASFMRQFDALFAVSENRSPDFRLSGLLQLLLFEVIDAWKDAGCPARPDGFHPVSHRFSELLAFMETHLAERLTRDDLAERVHLHPGYFDRAFRAVCGVPPMKMMQQMRLARARRLLETTDDTLETVAGKTGLGDAARLSRLFRAQYHQTPGAFRAEAQAMRREYIPTTRL